MQPQKEQQYQLFAQAYQLDAQEMQLIREFYEIEELLSFLPPNPTQEERQSLKNLLGTTTDSGYLDYQQSNNTFELIMQWREKTLRWE